MGVRTNAFPWVVAGDDEVRAGDAVEVMGK